MPAPRATPVRVVFIRNLNQKPTDHPSSDSDVQRVTFTSTGDALSMACEHPSRRTVAAIGAPTAMPTTALVQGWRSDSLAPVSSEVAIEGRSELGDFLEFPPRWARWNAVQLALSRCLPPVRRHLMYDIASSVQPEAGCEASTTVWMPPRTSQSVTTVI